MSFRSYVENLYTDKLKIIRYTVVENDDGTTGEAVDESQELNNIPCHISSLKMDERNQANWDTDEVEARVKIFLSPVTKIAKGDEIIADRYLNGVKVQTYKGFAGDPLLYDLAQEFILLEKRVKTNEF